MRTIRPVGLLLALLVAAACGSNPTAATTSPTPATVLDDHFGFIVGNAVRRESDTKPLFILGIPNDTVGVVSPDGTRLAYLLNNELHVIDIKAGALPRTPLAMSRSQRAVYLPRAGDRAGPVLRGNGTGAAVNGGTP